MTNDLLHAVTAGHKMTAGQFQNICMVVPVRKVREFQKREQEILQAALDLFDTEQWDKVTVAQIAAHTGIGKGTIYKHFSSKEDIYARLALDDAKRLLDEFRLAMGEGRGVERMRRLLLHSFERHRNHSVLGAIHMYCKQRSFRERISADYQRDIQVAEAGFAEVFSEPIIQAIAEGDIADLPLEVLFNGMRATFEGALMLLRNQDYACIGHDSKVLTDSEFIAQTVDYMMAALVGMPARQP